MVPKKFEISTRGSSEAQYTAFTMSSFEDNTEAFQKFLVDSGVDLSGKIAIADLREKRQGRGVIATEDISANETLFTLPADAVLNHETCDLFKSLPNEKTNEFLEKYSQWEVIVMCLFYETEIVEKSRFQPYFNVLPKNFDTLIFWNDEELKKLEPLLIVSRIGKSESEEMYEHVKEGLSELGTATERLNKDTFHRLASWVQSYSFDVDASLYSGSQEPEEEDEEIEEEQIKTMVCLADTLNADTHLVNANLTYENGKLVMKATKDIRKNEQIYNTYGELPNSEILRRYGYVEWKGLKYDSAEISLESVISLFIEKYGADRSLVQNVLDLLAEDQELIEESDEIISSSYVCFIDPDISPEFQFLVQLLTSIIRINEGDHGFSSLKDEEKPAYIKRFTKKILQLISGKRLTEKAEKNIQELLDRKINEYPKEIVLTSLKLDVPKQATREDMAQCVLRCEVNALKLCKKYFEKNGYLLVEDGKLERNLLKRYGDKNESEKKRRKK